MRVSKSNIDSVYRGFKIGNILNPLSIIPERFESFSKTGEFKVINENFKNDIITGSLVLKLFYNIFTRPSEDIDIIVNYEPVGLTTHTKAYDCGDYIGSKNIKVPGRRWYQKDSRSVDFFQTLDLPAFIEYNGLKFHRPLDIIGHKVEMIKNNSDNLNKHLKDIELIYLSYQDLPGF